MAGIGATIRNLLMGTKPKNLFRPEYPQEKIDIFKISSVILHHEHAKEQIQKLGAAATFKDSFPLEETQKALIKMDFDGHKKIVETHVGQQMQRLFKFLREQTKQRGNDILPYPSRKRINGIIEDLKLKESISNGFQLNSDSLKPKKLRPKEMQTPKNRPKMEEEDADLPIYKYTPKNRKNNIYNNQNENLIGPEGSWPSSYEHPDGFSLEISESSITHPAAGDGLFVRGHCLPGTLICIYPGSVYTRPQIINHPEVIDGNEYMIGRYDGLIVDGRDWAKKAWMLWQTWAAGMSINQNEMKKYYNPFATGQYINHPPPKTQPNVASMSWDFYLDSTPEKKFSLEKEDLPYIPNELCPSKSPKIFNNISNPSNSKKRTIPSVIILSTRHIHNEELYLNYRFNPKATYPDWYEQPDHMEAVRRWQKPTWFGMEL